MTKPSDKHMEAANALRGAVNWSSNVSVEIIARALAEAEREGMRRAAEIVRGGREVSDPNDDYRSTITVNWDDDDACAEAILSEAGEA